MKNAFYEWKSLESVEIQKKKNITYNGKNSDQREWRALKEKKRVYGHQENCNLMKKAGDRGEKKYCKVEETKLRSKNDCLNDIIINI